MSECRDVDGVHYSIDCSDPNAVYVMTCDSDCNNCVNFFANTGTLVDGEFTSLTDEGHANDFIKVNCLAHSSCIDASVHITESMLEGNCYTSEQQGFCNEGCQQDMDMICSSCENGDDYQNPSTQLTESFDGYTQWR